MFTPIAAVIARELSGHRARNHVVEIHGSDRFSSFDRYHDTARYCLAQMRALGLDGVESLPCMADGRTAYGDWIVPRAWDARDAVLRLADSGHILARYPDVPASLFMYSAPTPPGGIDTALIEVDDPLRIPDSFKGRMVCWPWGKGRRLSKAVRKALVARGIVGVALDMGKIDFPDSRGWENYAFAPRNEEGMFGFSLSFREAQHLRAALKESGEVRVHAQVDTRLYDGAVETLTGYIAGTQDREEVLLLAHLYEQGANDNASGAGLGLEVLRALKSLIDGGALPRPHRSLRLLLGFECCGFMGYVVSHGEVMGRTVAAINPDMVGEDTELCGTSFRLHLTPGAAPSCVDALACRLFEDLVAHKDPLFRWRKLPFTLCDSFIADPSIGVPSLAIIGLPDRNYHTSMDTPDKVSPKTLDEIGLIIATYLYFLADAGPEAASWMAEEAAAQARRQIVDEAAGFIRRAQVDKTEEVLCQAAERMDYLVSRHRVAVASALRFAADAGVASRVDRLQTTLRRDADTALEDLRRAMAPQTAGMGIGAPTGSSEPERRAARLVPRRRVPGPLTLEPLALRQPGDWRWSPGWSAPHNDYLIWADGARSLLEIWKSANQESGRRLTDLPTIVEYFEFLVEHGYAEWVT